MNELMFFIIVIGLFLLEEFVFANTRYFWLGGIVPLLGTIGILFIMMKSSNLELHDYFMALMVIVVLLVFWGDGHTRYRKRMAKQKNKMLSQDLSETEYNKSSKG